MDGAQRLMKILDKSSWVDGFVDYHRAADEYRVRVRIMHPVRRLDDVYVVRPESLRLVWNYLRDVGPSTVIRKIRSRRREALRNEKYVAIGAGEIVERPNDGRFTIGQTVVFIAPAHPACVEHIVVPEALLSGPQDPSLTFCAEQGIRFFKYLPDDSPIWDSIAGWSPYSGTPLDPVRCCEALESAGRRLRSLEQNPNCLGLETTSSVHERSEKASSNLPGMRAALFGYGNFAKTMVLPHLPTGIRLACVHEIDPTQIPTGTLAVKVAPVWDSSPSIRQDERYDMYLIAGFHHTHAPIACQGLAQGAAVMVEKPMAVTYEQLERLLFQLRNGNGKLFACFQRRYSSFNALVWEDLGITKGEPISYHAVVYETPMPTRHWYNWPNSMSRLVSDSCHWLDHFLYLNDFSKPSKHSLHITSDGSFNCSVELENGAFFTIVLTEWGSSRLGTQDYVELRHGDRTVKIVSNSQYFAESSTRILRRRRKSKVVSYASMYRTIGERILRGEDGDSMLSVDVSTRLMLDLENEFLMLRENS